MFSTRIRSLMTLLVVVFASGAALAEVKLPSIIGDHMVLQCEKPIPIWGTADANEKVTVKLGSEELTATADAAGKWQVKFKPLALGATPELTVFGSNMVAKTQTITDILVGEVWVCSGQSNMQFAFSAAHDAATEGPLADKPNIRLFLVKNVTAFEPQTTCVGQWVLCTPTTVKNFPAVGYFFGSEIHSELKRPVGLIGTSWGGTVAEAWTSLEALQGETEMNKAFAEPFIEMKKNLPALIEKYKTQTLPAWQKQVDELKAEMAADKAYQEQLAKWQEAAKAAKADGKAEPAKPNWSKQIPRQPSSPEGNPNISTVLFNGMIAPLIPFPIRGAIWYQGESNASRATQYRTLLPTMITDWRTRFGVGDFGFGIVQLANFQAPATQPADSAWGELREAQSMTAAKLPNVGIAVAIDLADVANPGDIHPKNKHEVGHRLALWARAKIYGEKIVYSGPVFDKQTIDGGKVTLSFTQIGGGLVAKEIASAKPGELKGFELAGEDKKFYFADAVIKGDKVVVTSAEVSKPVAVRYAWEINPICNLYNKEGLPASPFRTDEWPIIPPAKK